MEITEIERARRTPDVTERLVEYAFARWAADEVTVNEQNPRAKGFYEHMGFAAVGRLPVDEQGKPYPVLRMKRTPE